MKNLFAIPTILLSILSISTSAFADDTTSLSTGFDYSSGKYGGTTPTDIMYIPVTGKYESDALTMSLTVPYLSVTSNGGVVQGMGRIGPSGKMKTTQSGLGDIVASAGYTTYSADDVSLDIVGNIKLGTADPKKGLGTGQNDYSAQIDGYYTPNETTLFATAGYKVYGAPAGVSVSSAPYATIGISQKLSDDASAGVMLDITKSPVAASPDKREVTVYVSQKTESGLKVQANILKGFSSGSPDFGGGVMITGYF